MMTNAERQRRYRAKLRDKAKRLKLYEDFFDNYMTKLKAEHALERLHDAISKLELDKIKAKI